MKHAPFIVVITAALMAGTIASDASAQRMRDFSLSEKESMRVPNSNSHPSGNYDQFMNQNNNYQNNGSNGNGGGFRIGNYNNGSSNYNTQLPNQPSTRFMVGYCDENFQPMLSNSGRVASLNACIDEQKKQACDLFGQLPSDVQRVMDTYISCVYNQANQGMDENGYAQIPAGIDCTGGDTQRIELIKKYWSNQNITYGLVFLPDMVLDAPSRCMGSR